MIEAKNKVSGVIINSMERMGHEQVVFCHDEKTGLRSIIAIHDTTLGPALGGARMWNYDNENDALRDVLRLSRGMTFKAAISGLDLGGGKAVIIGDASVEKSQELMKRFGQFVDTLGGKYITAEDVGMTIMDMEDVRSQTTHVTGTPEEMGGSGDPAPITAYGVYMGMKASSKFKWGDDKLEGRKILVEGVGKVGETLVQHLVSEGAIVYVSDIDHHRLEEVSLEYGAKIVDRDSYNMEMDIYAPCALGATLNTHTIRALRCSIIAGAANNQLQDENIHGNEIKDKGIVYAPDFLINAGGLISVYSELKKYNKDQILKRSIILPLIY